MSIRAKLQMRKARARSSVAGFKSRIGSRGRGAMFGNKLSGLRYRISRVRTRQRLG